MGIIMHRKLYKNTETDFVFRLSKIITWNVRVTNGLDLIELNKT